MTDIIDTVNEDFQNGQTILRGRRLPQLLARAFELRTALHNLVEACALGDFGESSEQVVSLIDEAWRILKQ